MMTLLFYLMSWKERLVQVRPFLRSIVQKRLRNLEWLNHPQLLNFMRGCSVLLLQTMGICPQGKILLHLLYHCLKFLSLGFLRALHRMNHLLSLFRLQLLLLMFQFQHYLVHLNLREVKVLPLLFLLLLLSPFLWLLLLPKKCNFVCSSEDKRLSPEMLRDVSFHWSNIAPLSRLCS